MTTSPGGAITFAVRGPLERDDLPALYRRICRLLREMRPTLAYLEVENVSADAVAVDALCRLALAARRRSCEIRLRGASKELLELVAFVGLEEVLPE
jgi:ABC-type transporter Mla MlaB component